MNMIPAPVNEEIRHSIVDADGVSPARELIIECDNHGLTVEFPDGGILTIDLSHSVFSVYWNNDSESDSLRIHGVSLKGK